MTALILLSTEWYCMEWPEKRNYFIEHCCMNEFHVYYSDDGTLIKTAYEGTSSECKSWVRNRKKEDEQSCILARENAVRCADQQQAEMIVIHADQSWNSWKCRCGCLNRRDIGTCGRCRGQFGYNGYSVLYGDNDFAIEENKPYILEGYSLILTVRYNGMYAEVNPGEGYTVGILEPTL